MVKHEAEVLTDPEKVNAEIDEKYNNGPKQINFLNETEMVLCKTYSRDQSASFNATHFVGSAFVSFKYQHYRDHILEKYSNDR